jgi:citrate synthase
MGIVEVLCLCAFNLASFAIGAKIGQKIVRQETIEVNPVKAVNTAIEAHKEALVKEAEDEYYKAIYQNIDNYSGDSLGQIDIPKRK